MLVLEEFRPLDLGLGKTTGRDGAKRDGTVTPSGFEVCGRLQQF